jgi:hypothetical protein
MQYKIKYKTSKVQFKKNSAVNLVWSVWEKHISQSVSSWRSDRIIKYKVQIIRVSQLSVHPLSLH